MTEEKKVADITNLFSEVAKKLKEEIILEITSINKRDVEELVLELRMDMEEIIEKSVKRNLSIMFNRISDLLKEEK